MDDKVGHPLEVKVLDRTWGMLREWFLIREANKHAIPARWDGHATNEALNEWISGGWNPCDLIVGAYTEGRERVKYGVPKGFVVAAITRIVVEKGRYVKLFRVVTRDAKGKEREIHNRFPVIRKPRY